MSLRMCLLGRGIAHSLSPRLFEAGFAHLGIEGSYELRDCASREEALALMREGGFDAMNVTTPYKTDAFAAADEVESAASVAMGANLLVRKPQGLAAFNTDGSGCVAFLLRSGVALKGAEVAVCGTGPTALAISASLLNIGARVTLLSRNGQKAQLLAGTLADGYSGDSCSGAFEAHIVGLGYGEAQAAGIISSAGLIVDATGCGMQEGQGIPFDASQLHSGQVVLETVYGHGKTALLQAAQEAGCRAFDGTGMLVSQAVIGLQLVIAQLGLGCDMAFGPLHQAMAKAMGDE